MSTIYSVIKRPVITEKGLMLKENERTLCFEVADHASKTQIHEAVERIFKVKVLHVRTMTVPGKERRRALEERRHPAREVRRRLGVRLAGVPLLDDVSSPSCAGIHRSTWAG